MAALNISEVDFFKQKDNLKTFYASQNEFLDFDFEGSAINILLDALAYTSHYAGVHLNMASSEMFLGSAQLRSSVVSKSKDMGYIPYQMSAAKVIIGLSITPADSPIVIDVPKGTEFSVSLDGNSYTFVTTQSYQLQDKIGNGVYIGDVEAIQGKLMYEEWVYDATDPTQKFVILNKQIDPSTLQINIQHNTTGGTIEAWSLADNIISLDRTSKSYFIQETSNGSVEVYFGDDIIGAKPIHDNLIKVSYIATDGILGNNMHLFSLVGSIDGYSPEQFALSVASASGGGGEKETIESIKISAPLSYATQSRAVVPSDYRSLVKSKFGFLESISVWGGEDNNPPQYGKVFLAAKPTYGNVLSNVTKTEITKYLKSLNIVGIRPDVIDADFVYVNVVSDVEFQETLTTDRASDISTKVSNAVISFFDSDVVSFGSELIYSSLVSIINSASSAIKGNLTHLYLSRHFTPSDTDLTSVSLDYANAVLENTVFSSTWLFGGDSYKIVDDGLGNLHEYKNDIKSGLLGAIGSVDYETGVVNILAYQFNISPNTQIDFKVTPTKNNVLSTRNILIRLDVTSPVINAVGLK